MLNYIDFSGSPFIYWHHQLACQPTYYVLAKCLYLAQILIVQSHYPALRNPWSAYFFATQDAGNLGNFSGVK